MRAERLLRLQLLLHARGGMTAEALAEETGVSVRTVYRDLDLLSLSGVPVYAELGPGGGFRLLGTYRSPLGELTPEEADALLAVGVPGVLSEVGLAEPVHRAQLKIAPRARHRETLIHFDAPRWFHDHGPPVHLSLLAKAVQERRTVQVTVEGHSSTLEPLGLVNKAGIWYLVARSERGISGRRVDRLERAETLEDQFSRPRKFDLARWWEEWSSAFERDLPQIDVRVRCTRALATRLPAILGDAVKPRLAAAEADGDWVVFSLSFDSAVAAASRLAGLAPELVVLAPEDVLVQLRKIGDAVRGTYGHASGSSRRSRPA